MRTWRPLYLRRRRRQHPHADPTSPICLRSVQRCAHTPSHFSDPCSAALHTPETPEQLQSARGRMKYVKLGANGPEVSVVCLVSCDAIAHAASAAAAAAARRRSLPPLAPAIVPCTCQAAMCPRQGVTNRPMRMLPLFYQLPRSPSAHVQAPPPAPPQGTMTWGEQNTEAEAWEQLDYALAHGINFIDTGELREHAPCLLLTTAAHSPPHRSARPASPPPMPPPPATCPRSRAVSGAAPGRDVRQHGGDDWAVDAGARLPRQGGSGQQGHGRVQGGAGQWWVCCGGWRGRESARGGVGRQASAAASPCVMLLQS